MKMTLNEERKNIFRLMGKLDKTFKPILNEIMSKIPTDGTPNTDEEILRTAIIAELDAVNLYTQMANNTKNEKLKKILLDVAKEEKTHVGEFEALLNIIDTEHKEELEVGKEEVEDLTSGKNNEEIEKNEEK